METTENNIETLLARANKIEKKAKYRMYLYTFLPFITGITLVVFFVVKISSAKNELEILKNKNRNLAAILDIKERKIGEFSSQIDSLNNIYYALEYNASEDFAWSSKDLVKHDSVTVKNSKLAHDEILKLIQNKRINVNVTIRYYTKKLDKGKIDLTLKKCGFRQIVIDNDNYKNQNYSNAIYFSENINVETIKAVAYSLIRTGVEINVLKKYPRKIAKNKPNSIEISHDNKADISKKYTVEDIKSAENFN